MPKAQKGADMKKSRLQRVDFQVSLLTALLVILSCSFIHLFHYQMSYRDMIKVLSERVYSIYHYVENNLDRSTFLDINTIEDKEKACYREAKELLTSAKGATSVRYLYTAKKDKNGNFIYVVDGLSSTAADFRNPGDPIEVEIIDDMGRALLGQEVLPKEIKKTEWGKIFITYMPIHDKDQVVGVLGIEFEAEHQYRTYQILRICTPLIIIMFCLLAMWASVLFFKRISNPGYRNMMNTDRLTGLKNRNAYDVDLKNIAARKQEEGIGLVFLDLNDLKKVNDTMGHQAGDMYIRSAAEALSRTAVRHEVVYRIGGDEFVVLARDSSEAYLKDYLERLFLIFSIAAGYALYDGNIDKDIYGTVQRADAAMYKNKEEYHRKNDLK